MPKIKQNLTVDTDSAAGSENLKTPFAQVLLEIIEDPRISAGAFRLYTLLIGLSRGFGACWPSQATLAAKLGITQRTVRNWLKELEIAGYLEIEHRYAQPGQEQSNIYHLKKLVPRQGEQVRNAITSDTGTELPPTPERNCQPHRNKISAYIHELDLHAKENINTQGKAKSGSPVELEQGVCELSGDTKILDKLSKPDQEEGVNKQLQDDQAELTLILVKQQLKQAGVSAKRLHQASQLVVQNGRTARYVEGWLNWIGRQAYIQNPAAYLLSRIQDNTDVPHPRTQAMPSRSFAAAPSITFKHPGLEIEPAEVDELPGEPGMSVQPEEDLQPDGSPTSRKLRLVLDNTRQKSPSTKAGEDWPGLRLIVDKTTLSPDDLLSVELVSAQSEASEPELEDSGIPAETVPEASRQNKSVNPSATTVDFRLKELMIQRDSRIRRVKRLEVIGASLYVAFWSVMDKEAGVGSSWLADARFLYPTVTKIELL